MAFSHSPKTVTDGLVLCLDAANTKSYPGSGTAWKDLAGSSNGTLTNGPTFDSSNGGSIVFDGVDDIVSTTGNTLTESEGGVSLWFSRAGNDNSQRLVRRLGSNINRYYLLVGPNIVYGVRGENNTRAANFSFAVNEFIHVTWQWRLSDTLQQIYINGSIIYNGTYVPVTSGGNTTFGLAQAQGAEVWFSGNVALASVYNRVLTSTEIQQNYNATKGRFGL